MFFQTHKDFTTVEVDAEALAKLLNGLNGPEDHIRLMKATRDIHVLGIKNPIVTLSEQYMAAYKAFIDKQGTEMKTSDPATVPKLHDLHQHEFNLLILQMFETLRSQTMEFMKADMGFMNSDFSENVFDKKEAAFRVLESMIRITTEDTAKK